MGDQILVIGAGVAGLSCASRLEQAGVNTVVLDKGRGVGGRCATRRVEEQPMDHGVIFLHGSDPGFLAALDAVENATPIPGWPQRLHGSGTPCQPEAFHSHERRLAFAEGLSSFPKHIAASLDVRLNTRVVSVKASSDTFTIRSEDGKTWKARTVVVTAPVEQTIALLKKLPDDSEELRSVRALLDMIRSEPCLTLLAGYPLEGPTPSWDVCYPEDSNVFVLMSHDSAKRRHKSFHTLVYQARPRWSRERLDQDPDSWSREALEEAERLIAPWAREPQWTQAHRWSYARVDPASALASPVLMEIKSGLRLGLAGEVFAYSGGVEAAWLSGRRLAERILGDRKA